ncbi:NADP-dependent oxidoreductase [Nannocystis sp. ILAH1]|uniref:NADP-dependent oxidoreductase n=1 Tax=unclassified Nannocystis TaxID=2627009 RepID=UPI00226DDA6B|nr:MULTISPECIES: NADP-dependent oxidoreductase [unclassified Nannocystis]MCY0988023.1 NADP-dependent oxidoreductase [Nannocystis sp. ILAH1]MCY1065636.1 NADP-dependent oxidoreductase [Nannocystis sp. RBIL2]
MRTVVIEAFGGPEVLKLVERPQPQPGKGEVRIRVHAATVNPTDLLLRSGEIARLVPKLPPFPYTPGMDAAGVIDAVGPEGDGRLKVGDRVVAVVMPLGPHGGAYAEQLVVPAASVVPVPAGADMPAASTLLMNALTVRLALDALALRPGQTLAVTGAAGAIGGYAIQLAKADDLRVIVDASVTDHALVQSLGADIVLERGDDLAHKLREVAADGVDAVIDAAMLHERILPAIKDGGGIATVRGWSGPTERGIVAHPIFVTTGLTDTAKLDRLRQQAEDGVLTLRVARVFPAAEAAEAHRVLEAGGLRGRPVLDFT